MGQSWYCLGSGAVIVNDIPKLIIPTFLLYLSLLLTFAVSFQTLTSACECALSLFSCELDMTYWVKGTINTVDGP